MPSEERYWDCRAKGICTECEHRLASNGTRCTKCYIRNQTAKVLDGVENFTAIDLENLKVVSEGRCQICKRVTKLVFDHCHKRRKARGLLCNSCNRGLGLFQDDSERLRNAAEYLDTFGRSQ